MDTGFFDSRIRVIPDWPEPGVQFRDLFAAGEAVCAALAGHAECGAAQRANAR